MTPSLYPQGFSTPPVLFSSLLRKSCLTFQLFFAASSHNPLTLVPGRGVPLFSLLFQLVTLVPGRGPVKIPFLIYYCYRQIFRKVA